VERPKRETHAQCVRLGKSANILLHPQFQFSRIMPVRDPFRGQKSKVMVFGSKVNSFSFEARSTAVGAPSPK